MQIKKLVCFGQSLGKDVKGVVDVDLGFVMVSQVVDFGYVEDGCGELVGVDFV